jgi:hypothetical protein
MLQSLVLFAVHCPAGAPLALRNAALACLQSALSAFAPRQRLRLLRGLLAECPYPHVGALLLDRARADMAAEHRAAITQALPPAFLSRALGEMVMAAARTRLSGGLLQAGAGGQGAPGAPAGPLEAALSSPDGLGARAAARVASHLARFAEHDVALLSLLRLALMLSLARARTHAAAAAAAASAAVCVSTGAEADSAEPPPSAPLPPFLRHAELALLRDSFVLPLLRGAAAAQRPLRAAAGLSELRSVAHAAPFVAAAGAHMSAVSVSGAGADAGAGAGTAEQPRVLGRGLLAAAPAGGERGADLSRLLLLAAAAAPALEALDEAVAARRDCAM